MSGVTGRHPCKISDTVRRATHEAFITYSKMSELVGRLVV